MASGPGTSYGSQRQGDEVSEVLSLIQEEAGSTTLMLIAVVTTQSVKLLEERCHQLLPEQHIIITTADHLPEAVEKSARSPSTTRLTVLVSSRFSRISIQVPSQFQRLSLLPTGRRRHGLSLHVQEDSTFCDVPLHSWFNRTMHKNHEFIHREGMCLVTGMTRMAEQAGTSASNPPLSEDTVNVVKETLDRLSREATAWETESEDTDLEKTSDEETYSERTDKETSPEPGAMQKPATEERSPQRPVTRQTGTQGTNMQGTGANRSNSGDTASFWETWKSTIAIIVGALAGVSSGAAYLTMTVKGLYFNYTAFTVIVGKFTLTAACAASVGVGVGLGVAAAIYFIPWDKVFEFLGNKISSLGEKLAAIWALLKSRFNSTRRRQPRAMSFRF